MIRGYNEIRHQYKRETGSEPDVNTSEYTEWLERKLIEANKKESANNKNQIN